MTGAHITAKGEKTRKKWAPAKQQYTGNEAEFRHKTFFKKNFFWKS